MTILHEYHVTFGQRYRHEKHPSGYPVHPDGYGVVYASSYDEAHSIVVQTFDTRWSDIYEKGEIFNELYPRGPLFEIRPIITSSSFQTSSRR